MPTINFRCPTCNELYRAYVDETTVITCYCGERIKPSISGYVEVYQEQRKELISELRRPITAATKPISKPIHQYLPNSSQLKPTNGGMGVWNVIFLVLGVLFILAYAMDFITSKRTKDVTKGYTTTTIPVTPQPSTISPSNSTPNLAPPTSNQTILNVHIVNSFMHTDKMVRSEAVIDETTKTLTLTDVAKQGRVVKILSEGEGNVTIQFYNNGMLETTKEFNRSSDLEPGDGTIIYTSRTGEITVTLSSN